MNANLPERSAGRTCFAILALLLATVLGAAPAAAADDDDIYIAADSAKLPRSSNARNGHVPLGTPEYPGLCPYRGHAGKYRCVEVKATDHAPYGCKGKQIYLSGGACYSCPDGYKRANILRKMAGDPKACTKRGFGKDPKPATYVRPAKCGKGQFKHDGRCKSCLARTKRVHLAGLDSGVCKVDEKFHCNAGLTLHKSAPTNVFSHAGNWLGLKHRKYCGEPFNLNAYFLEAAASEANKLVIEALVRFGWKMAGDDPETQRKVRDFKQAIEAGKLSAAYDTLGSFNEFALLERAASEAQKFAVTVGVTGNGAAGIGYDYEYGLAVDVGTRKLKKYQTHGLSKGVSFVVSGGISVGASAGKFETGYQQGFTVNASGVGVGMWSDYYTPRRADRLNQPHLVGISASFGAGAGVEIGDYHEVYTKVTE